MEKRWFAFLGLVISVAHVSAEELPHCAVDLGTPPEFLVGDAVVYQLRGCPPRSQIQEKSDPRESGILVTQDHLLVFVKSGELPIPALSVVDEKGNPVALTDPFTVKVRSNLKEGEQAKPEGPIGYLNLAVPGWVLNVIGILILTLIGVLVFLLIRWSKRRAQRLLKNMFPKKSYDVLALERLQALMKAGHLERQEFKPFAFGISETMKFYLGERFKIDALESTTSELFERLDPIVGSPGLDSHTLGRLKKMYDFLDLVKFTDHAPDLGITRAVWDDSIEIIEISRVKTPEGGTPS